MKNNILIHIPHSSLRIPKIFFSQIIDDKNLKEENLKMSDIYVDKLINKNYHVLKFNYSRLFCDVERFVDDDKEIMAKKGMGVLYTKDSNGNEFIKYDIKYKEFVLENYYHKHHNKLNVLCEKILKKFDDCIIIDLHSFSEEIVGKFLKIKDSPDICIGIDYNFYDQKLEKKVIDFFENKGYTVKINYPFSGSIVPNKFLNNKTVKLKTIMIEINKKIYLDNEKINNKNFKKLKKHINELLKHIND